MLLSCPSCTTSYQIPDDAVGSSGRKVKCHKCGDVWHAMPETAPVPAPAVADAAVAAKVEQIEPAAFNGDWEGEEHVTDAPGADEELNELRGLLKGTGLEDKVGEKTLGKVKAKDDTKPKRRRLRIRRRRDPGDGAHAITITPARMVAAAAIAGILAGGALYMRNDIVSALPGTARLYAAVGYPVNLRGLEFHNVGFETVIENGLPVLAVRGEVVNVTDKPVQIPDIFYSLRNHRMQEIYVWTGKPSQRSVQPAGRASFATRLLAPPIGAEQVQIRFVPEDRPAGRS